MRVIIILATILCRLQSFPLDIFQSSQEVKDGEGRAAADCEEDFWCVLIEQQGGWLVKDVTS